MSEPARNNFKLDDDADNRDLSPPRELSAGASEFVESMGMLMERYGVARIGGRILGLFMLDEDPLSLDDVARLLGVSRASVSTNLRMTEMVGWAKKVSRPGDRRDYYVGSQDMWMQGIKSSKQDSIEQIAAAARSALPKIPPEDVVARRHLEDVIDFAEFFAERLDQMMVEWETRKAKRAAERERQQNAKD